MTTLLERVCTRLCKLEQRVRRPMRGILARRSLTVFRPPYRLNVGCGNIPFHGWINVDANYVPGVTDMLWDATDPFPMPNGCCEFIYNEHFLEHLSVESGFAFLKECHRLLQPGGVLRVAMPAINEPVRQYYEDDWKNQPWLEKYGYTWIKTRAEMLNIAFRYWGHQWLYDREELHRRLTEAGFESIRDAHRGESTVVDLQDRETRDETLLVCEAIK